MSLLPQLEHDLRQAADKHLPAAQDRHRTPNAPDEPLTKRRRLARLTASLPVAAAVITTVIVVGAALTLAHRARTPSPRTTSPAQAQTGHQQLLAAFGILRRAQTHADLDPELVPGTLRFTQIPARYGKHHQRPPASLLQQIKRLGYPKLDHSLVRVVSIPAWHAKAAIVPTTWQPSPKRPRRSEGVDLELWIGTKPSIPPSSFDGTGPPPTTVQTLRTHGLTLTNNAPDKRSIDGIVLVPDGVATVTIQPVHITRTPFKVNISQFGTARAAVHDNIAAFQLPMPTATNTRLPKGMTDVPAIAVETWKATDGQIIKRSREKIDLEINLPGHTPSQPSKSTHSGKRSPFCRLNPQAC
jgi:hypothetical protein